MKQKKPLWLCSVGWGYQGNKSKWSNSFFAPSFLPLGSLGFHLIYLLSISWSFYLSFLVLSFLDGFHRFLLHYLGWPSEVNSRAPLPLLLSPLNSCWFTPPPDIPFFIYSYVYSLPLLSLTSPSLTPPLFIFSRILDTAKRMPYTYRKQNNWARFLNTQSLIAGRIVTLYCSTHSTHSLVSNHSPLPHVLFYVCVLCSICFVVALFYSCFIVAVSLSPLLAHGRTHAGCLGWQLWREVVYIRIGDAIRFYACGVSFQGKVWVQGPCVAIIKRNLNTYTLESYAISCSTMN